MQYERANSSLRIRAVIEWSKMSTNHFAHHIGLPRSQTLYRVCNGANGISKALAQRIVASFPDLSELWLLTGRGQMLKCEQEEYVVPLFRLDVESKLRNLEQAQPDHFISMPMIEGAELAVISRGDAMAPRIPEGAMLFLKSIDLKEFVPGNDYLLLTGGELLLRTVRVGSDDHLLALEAENSRDYDRFEVERTRIRRAWRVMAHLVLHGA